MPRGLSLKKKAPQPGKEQRTITSFFKNAVEKKPTTHCDATEELKSAKRKATSPIINNSTTGTLKKGKKDSERRVPLVEILDSPSNSPPSSKCLDEKSKRYVKTSKNIITSRSENVDGSVVLVLDENIDSQISNLQLKRSPQKLKTSAVLPCPSTCEKKLALEKIETHNHESINKNGEKDVILQVTSPLKVLIKCSVNENNISDHFTKLQSSELELRSNCGSTVLKCEMKNKDTDPFDKAYYDKKKNCTQEKNEIVPSCLSSKDSADVKKNAAILSQTVIAKSPLSSPIDNYALSPHQTPRKLNLNLSPAKKIVAVEEIKITKFAEDSEVDSMFGDEWSIDDITPLSSVTALTVSKTSLESIELKENKRLLPRRTTEHPGDRVSPRKRNELEKKNSATGEASVNYVTLPTKPKHAFSPQRSQTQELEDLDLGSWQRCEVIKVTPVSDNCSELKLKDSTDKRATCRVEGIWNTLPLHSGDIVNVQAVRPQDGAWLVSSCGGLLALRPDLLLSSTVVAGAVFCRRKAVLQERFRGMDCGNKAMTVGILVHELLQLCLQRRLCSVPAVKRACERLLASARGVRLLYDAGMGCAEARDELNTFVPQVVRFVDEHVVNPRGGGNGRKAEEWSGRVESVLDIEENICCPQVGVKGKIDVTLQVNIHNRKELVPLELKTGRASGSAEHRGQLILYMMMMSLQQGREVSQGLLLYLRDIITLKVVTSGYPEKRDLLMLRNQLAQYLAPHTRRKQSKSEDCSSETSATERELLESGTGNLELPEPINHHACGKCAYLTLCSVYQWHTDGTPLSENHILRKLRSEALGHLSETHVQYFLRWTALLLLEDLEKSVQGALHHIWTMSPRERELRGQCLSDLLVSRVNPSGDRFLHTFKRPIRHENMSDNGRSVVSVGNYVVVSTERKVCVAAGIVTQLDPDLVCVALERDLTARNATEALYHVDAYESQSQLMFNFTNLGALMDNDEKSKRLRSLIIDRSPASFAARLPREVGRVGARLLKSLNLLQQRAVLRAIAADQYTLIHGMPGTGKTQTVVVLVQMLVALGQRVLVTAHTHSAVDNVLQRLPSGVRVLRLGSATRVSPQLVGRSEDALTADCRTPEELKSLYDSMEVVGVTCLGSGHSLLSKTQFDVCIVDESTQVVQCTILRPLMAARRFVLVGDPEQLPPLVRSPLARKLGMDESVFARLHGADSSVSLSAQYRMNGRVASLANRFTYGGLLTCASDEVENSHVNVDLRAITQQYSSTQPWLVDCLSLSLDKSVLLLDTGCTDGWMPDGARKDIPSDGNVSLQPGQATEVIEAHSSTVPEGVSVQTGRIDKKEEGGSKKPMNNVAEALAVMALVKAMFQAGLDANSIGVITPYRDQVTLLQKCIANLQSSLGSDRRRSPRKSGNANTDQVEVNTVDQYQGRDKSVIIYSCSKTWDPEKGDYTVKDSEILEDKRRLTVAITRAKHKLILLGDVATLRHYSTFSQLFNCLREMDREGSTDSVVDLKQPYDALYQSFGLFL